MYRPYCRVDGFLAKTQPDVWRRACEILEDLSAAEAEEIVGLEFPYDYRTYRRAVDETFPWSSDIERQAMYWAVQDAIRSEGEPWEHVDDEEWIAERYADFDDVSEEDESSFISYIRTLTYRRHDTESECGNVYDTGIRGTLLNPSDADREEFLSALAEHGPYAFILDEQGVYDVACVDTMYHLFQGIWDAPAFPDAITNQRQWIDRENYGHQEYNVANTIAIMRDFDFNDDEIAEFLRGNERDYACSYYFVNKYLRENGYRVYFDDPFEDD